MKVLITGGAGFIGSTLVKYLIDNTDYIIIINIDKLSYSGNLESIKNIIDSDRHIFEQVDICDIENITRIFKQYSPDSIIHLAAESHVDRSIDHPQTFINTNIVGTENLLEITRKYWNELAEDKKC